MKNLVFTGVILAFAIALTSCKIGGIKGNGNITSEIREMEDFDKIDISGNFEVNVEIENEVGVKIITDENLLKYVRTKVKNNTLHVYTKEHLRPSDELEVFITTPILRAIEGSGANDIMVSGITSDDFDVDLSGACSINLEGITNNLKIDISGAADIFAKNCIANSVDLDVSGAANAEVFSNQKVKADVSGAGNIELYGDANDIKTDISGAGSFNRK